MALSARSDVVPIDASLIPNFVQQIIVSQYYQVAIALLLVYDAIITMDREAKYFWKVPRKPVDIIYFANRYGGIFGALSFLYWDTLHVDLPSCIFSVWMFTVCNLMTTIFIDYILMIRVLALFHQERRLVICLNTLLALEAAFKLGMEIAKRSTQPILVAGLASITFCAVDVTYVMPHALLVLDALVPTIYGAILMVLGLFKATEYWKASAGFQGFTLVKVLIQDQLVYFMVVIICGVFRVLNIVLDIGTSYLSDLFVQLGNASFLCLLGTRMLYNLKDAGERGQNEGTSFRLPSKPLSKMKFVSPRNLQRFFHISLLDDINLIWPSGGEIQVDLNDVEACDQDGRTNYYL